MSWFERRLPVALLWLVVAGCGFQVRSSAEFPASVSVAYIQTADPYTPFYQALTEAIRASGRTLSDDPTAADTVIRILRDETGQRILSVSARNVPREYDVFYLVRYSVSMNGKEVLPPQQLALRRDYTYDETRVLGKSLEEEMLRQSLAEDLVGLIVRRIASVRTDD